MKKIHTFKESAANSFEDLLDKYLTESGIIYTEATKEEQRKGIDRIFEDGTKVDYKADSMAHKTGNYFIETMSVSNSSKPGWIYYSESDYIIYCVPQENFIAWIPLAQMKNRLDVWLVKYPKKQSYNRGYYSEGVLVPREEVEKLAVDYFN